VIDSNTIVKCQGSERIDLENMETVGIDWSKFDVGKAVEGLNEEEKAERMGQIKTIKELQKKLNKLKNTWKIVKRRML